MDRLREVYSGRVQGVGFRAITLGIASRFPVTGWVRNVADGTVELEAQGEPPAVQNFLHAVRSHFFRHISRVESAPLPPVDGEQTFIMR